MSCKDTWMAPVLQEPGHLGLSTCDAGNFSMTLLQGNLTRKLIHRMKKGITAWDFMQAPQLRQPAAILTKIFLLLFPGIHIHRVNTQGAGAGIYQRWGHSIIMKRQEDSRREGWDGGVGWEVGKSLQPSDCNALLCVTTARSRWRRSLKVMHCDIHCCLLSGLMIEKQIIFWIFTNCQKLSPEKCAAHAPEIQHSPSSHQMLIMDSNG